jgi:MscS family membrane protein
MRPVGQTLVFLARSRGTHGSELPRGDQSTPVGCGPAALRSAAESLTCALTPRIVWLLIVCYLALGPHAAAAQETVGVKAADTSSPRDTLRSFIDACNEVHDLVRSMQYFDRTDPEHLAIADLAVDCIDDSELPAFARIERAGEVTVCLKEILDRVELPPWEQIPDVAEIMAAGGFEKLTHYRIPDTRITISRVEQGPRRHEYLFSTGTADRAVRYYRTVKSKPYRTEGPRVSADFYRWYVASPGHPGLAAMVERLPERIRLGETWGMVNWKWIGLFVTLSVAIVLMVSAYGAYFHFSDRSRARSLFSYWLTLAFPIAAMLTPLVVKWVNYRYLTLRSSPLYITDFVAILVALLAAFVVIFAANNRIAASVIASRYVNPAGLNAQLISITSKLASFVAVVILFLVGGQYLGIPIATLLASAGIGGIAVALGAQDSLKTLFGTINLLADKPFRVGDRIVVEKYDGVVEDIGLRSSRVRLLNGHQVSIPNDQLAGNDIENVGRRPFIRRTGEIHIPLGSSCKKMEQAVAIIREELKDHEGMDPAHPPRVFFDEFTPGAFTIQFIYWYSPPDYWKFRAFGDKLNFNIFRRFEAQGIQFSLPLRHSFWKRGNVQGPLDVNLLSPGVGE